VRVDELEIGEIYRLYRDDERLIPTVINAQYNDDVFVKFGHTTLFGHQEDGDQKPWPSVDQLVMEPLVYIGTKPSRLYTHEPVEATHVFASPTGEKYCIQGRQIKYILPFTP